MNFIITLDTRELNNDITLKSDNSNLINSVNFCSRD